MSERLRWGSYIKVNSVETPAHHNREGVVVEDDGRTATPVNVMFPDGEDEWFDREDCIVIWSPPNFYLPPQSDGTPTPAPESPTKELTPQEQVWAIATGFLDNDKVVLATAGLVLAMNGRTPFTGSIAADCASLICSEDAD